MDSSSGKGVTVRSKFRKLLSQREATIERRITLEEVATETGVNVNTLTRWARPTPITLISSDVAYALCNYFGVTLNDLLEFVPPADN